MRIFLIFFSFANAFLYFALYAFYDNIIGLVGGVNAAQGFFIFMKILILIIFGFLIGLIVSFLLRINIEKSYFDYRTAIIVGIIPLILLVLSQNNITSFISSNIFGSNRQVSELLFYFLSRQIVFALWLGFAVGVSVRVAFKKKAKHEFVYNLEKDAS